MAWHTESMLIPGLRVTKISVPIGRESEGARKLLAQLEDCPLVEAQRYYNHREKTVTIKVRWIDGKETGKN